MRRGESTANQWRVAAARLGITLDEYRTRRLANQRWCCRCRRWLRVDAFAPCRARVVDTCCEQCRITADRGRRRSGRATVSA